MHVQLYISTKSNMLNHSINSIILFSQQYDGGMNPELFPENFYW